MKNDWITEQYIKETLQKKESDFYINSEGKRVMTESFHKKRGFCCGSGCLHCPYEPKTQKGNTNLKQ
jgi:hypothetical protein